MRKRIHIVREREGISNLGAFAIELKNRGYFVREYEANPNLAYFQLSTELESGLVILEKMIHFDENELPRGLMTRENTEDCNYTGFKLLEELIKDNPSMFPNSAVIYDSLYPNATNSELTKKRADKLGVEILNQDNAFDFGNAVEKLYSKLILK